MLLLDTHVLIWLTEGSQRLGSEALDQINLAFEKNRLGVATISFWEIAMLIQKERLEFDMKLDTWRSDLLQNGLQELTLAGTTAIRAGELSNFHGDPADRIIVATAIENAATLVTADKKILTWDILQQKIDASK